MTFISPAISRKQHAVLSIVKHTTSGFNCVTEFSLLLFFFLSQGGSKRISASLSEYGFPLDQVYSFYVTSNSIFMLNI